MRFHVCVLLGCLALQSSFTYAGSPYLIQDLDTAERPGGLGTPTAFEVLGDRLLFYVASSDGDKGVWSLDPNTLETEFLTRVSVGWLQGGVAHGDGFLLWRGRDETLETEGTLVVRSDGTAQGTFVLARGREEFNLDEANAFLGQLDGEVLFAGYSPESGWEPWTTDGTVEGTRALVDLLPGPDSFDLRHFVAFGSRACFYAGSNRGETFYCTDGTSAGTRAVVAFDSLGGADFRPARAGSRAVFLGASVDGLQVYSTDGSPGGTLRLTDFPASAWFLSELIERDGIVFFAVDDIVHGQELWQSDGTPSGTRRITEFGYAAPFSLSPPTAESLARVGGATFFFASDGLSPLAIWRTSGAPGTTRLAIQPCEGCLYLENSILKAVDGRIVFRASSQESGYEQRTLDPGNGSVEVLLDACPGSCDGAFAGPVSLAGLTLFTAGPGDDIELFVTNGRPGGTHAVTAIDPGGVHFAFSYPTNLAWLADRLWFAGWDPVNDEQIWSTALDPSTTSLATAFRFGISERYARDMAPVDGGAVFLACDSGGRLRWYRATASLDSETPLPLPNESCHPALSSEPNSAWFDGHVIYLSVADAPKIYRTDGTAEGTRVLAQFPSGDGIGDFVVGGGRVWILVEDSAGREIWSSDGTVPGTRLERKLGLDFSYVWGLHWQENRLFFRATQAGLGPRAWRFDVQAGSVSPLPPAVSQELYSRTDLPAFIEAEGGVYFIDREDQPGAALWRHDLAVGTTTALRSFGSISGSRRLLGRAGDQALFFVWNENGDGALELWSASTTSEETARIATLGHCSPEILDAELETLSAPPFLLFRVPTEELGYELWASDGTGAGTFVVPEGVPGTSSSYPTNLVLTTDSVYFVSREPAHGRELHRLDRGSGEVTRASDIGPGSLSSEVHELIATADGLYFFADDEVHGEGLWHLSFDGPPCPASGRALCLQQDRFQVEAHWRDFVGSEGDGIAVPLTPDTGYFWFFDPANVEVVLKVLDGLGINDRFWVFYGALSNVQYSVDVTDTASMGKRRYFNPPGRYASVGDVDAFAPNASITGPPTNEIKSIGTDGSPLIVDSFGVATPASGTCAPDDTRLCLQQGRFAVEATWRDFQGNTGVGMAVPLSTDTGYFWFFNDANVEAVIKVLDGRPINDRFWVYYGALSNVEYTLTVTDSLTGAVKQYMNPSGRFASVGDNDAF